ncbi:MAG: MFS transporter [Chloroflexi bacterium]|nr:MFS transporter [Chloroflexota bacterium]
MVRQDIPEKEAPDVTVPPKGIFYGWWIVFAGTAMMALSGGLYYQGFGVFYLPIVMEFGWSRTQTAAAFSLAQLEGGVIGPIEGYLVDRLGPRRLMLLGIPIMGAGFILLSYVDSLWMFYLAYIGGIAIGSSIGTSTPAFTAAANWFSRRRGLALGLVSAGVGVGSVILPGLAWVVEAYGWRTGAFLAGLVVWSVGIPAALVIRHRPEAYGYLPDGDPLPPGAAAAAASGGHGHSAGSGVHLVADQDFTVGEALRTRAFWLVAGSFGTRLLVSGGVIVHLIPYLVDRGFEATTAASFVGMMGVLSIMGRLGFGFVSDYFPKRYVVALSLVVMTLGLVVLANVQEAWHVALFVLLYGPTYGGLAAMQGIVRAEYFGRRYFATIQGVMGTAVMPGILSGPLLAAYVFDTFHDYRPVFQAFILVSIVSMLLILAAKPPVRRPQTRVAGQ